MVSQYMFSGLYLNPAYAGTGNYWRTTLLHRSQWIGIPGAPKTQIFSIEGPLKDERSGIGIMAAHDQIGITREADLYFNYSYRIPFRNNTTLALGLRGGMTWYQADFNKLIYWDEGDVIYQQGVQNNLIPNVGWGAWWYGQKHYIGLSIPQLLSYDPKESLSIQGNGTVLPRIRRHYYLTGGYVHEVNSDIVLKPSVLFKYVDAAPLEVDLNLNVLLKNTFWIGASYRTGDAVVGILEFQITPQFRAGYAFDYTLTPLQSFSRGTHEFMIGYDFGFDMVKWRSPRYF